MKIKRFILIIALFIISALCFTGCDDNLVRNTQIIYDDFVNVTVIAHTTDITIMPTTGEAWIEGEINRNFEIKTSVFDGTLTIEVVDNRKWYDKWGFSNEQEITVFLPERAYGSLNVKVTTGDVEVENLPFSDVVIEATTGDVELYDISNETNLTVKVTTGDVEITNCTLYWFNLVSTTGEHSITNVIANGFTLEATTGSATLDHLVVGETMRVNLTTGDVMLTQCDANEVYITTTTGDVKGSFYSDMVVFANTTTGKVDVPKLTNGHRCEITTTTGDIRITINKN